jgi:hypothetical protein
LRAARQLVAEHGRPEFALPIAGERVHLACDARDRGFWQRVQALLRDWNEASGSAPKG